ncbi:ATP-binding protein [Micromonospora craniellae]|uniref:ATP-binding protein n=1 Tax=Micromonospora craniellae TaxID=2294034 RepID=A0A372G0J8_9ACTN|nr:ATP-binding protein [Micromonospora craniellae]QOC91658.1 ATP-binding protein [Micromonospora craniellae]RFS46562.1 ATP-binding protein [Micromonospora craniellae]
MSNLAHPDAGGTGGRSSGAGEETCLLSEWFTAQTVTPLRHLLAAQIAAAGLTGDLAEDLVLAVHELVTNAVLHGGGQGRLDLIRRADLLVCEVSDHGDQPDADLPAHPPATTTAGGRGLWLAHQLTGALTLTRRPDGMTASVTASLIGQPAALPSLPPGPPPVDRFGDGGALPRR